jgi:hypothetical protein
MSRIGLGLVGCWCIGWCGDDPLEKVCQGRLTGGIKSEESHADIALLERAGFLDRLSAGWGQLNESYSPVRWAGQALDEAGALQAVHEVGDRRSRYARC